MIDGFAISATKRSELRSLQMWLREWETLRTRASLRNNNEAIQEIELQEKLLQNLITQQVRALNQQQHEIERLVSEISRKDSEETNENEPTETRLTFDKLRTSSSNVILHAQDQARRLAKERDARAPVEVPTQSDRCKPHWQCDRRELLFIPFCAAPARIYIGSAIFQRRGNGSD